MQDSQDLSQDENTLTRLNLDLRGNRFVIERDTLMNLPESILLCLFPNGLVLSRNQNTGGGGGLSGDEDDEEDEEEVYVVDVSTTESVDPINRGDESGWSGKDIGRIGDST